MVDFGIYYAYWRENYDASTEELKQYIRKVDEIGFDVLELNSDPLMDTPDSDLMELSELAEERGLELAFCVGLSEDKDISSKDEETRKEGIEYLKDTIQMVSDMEAELLSGLIYGAWNLPFSGGLDEKSDYIDRSVESMKEVVSKAEDLGVCCNVEVVNRFEQFMMNTGEEAVEYVERVGSPNIKVHLDTYHMNIEEDGMGDAIREVGDALGNFHVGENNRKPPGRGGHLSWSDMMEALKDIGYDGNVVMEPFLLPGGKIAQDIKLWRDLSEGKDLDEEVEKSLNFLKDKF